MSHIRDVSHYLNKYVRQAQEVGPKRIDFLGSCTPGLLRLFPGADMVSCLETDEAGLIEIESSTERDQFTLKMTADQDANDPNNLLTFIDTIIQRSILPEINASRFEELLISGEICGFPGKNALELALRSITQQIAYEANLKFGDKQVRADVFYSDPSNANADNGPLKTVGLTAGVGVEVKYREFNAIFDSKDQAIAFVEGQFRRFLAEQVVRCMVYKDPSLEPLGIIFALPSYVDELKTYLEEINSELTLTRGAVTSNMTCEELSIYQSRASHIFDQLRRAMAMANISPSELEALRDPSQYHPGVLIDIFKNMWAAVLSAAQKVAVNSILDLFIGSGEQAGVSSEQMLAEEMMLLVGGVNRQEMQDALGRHAGLLDVIDRSEEFTGDMPAQFSGLVQRIWLLWQRQGCGCDGGQNSLTFDPTLREQMQAQMPKEEQAKCEGIQAQLDGLRQVVEAMIENATSSTFSCREMFRDLETINSSRFTAPAGAANGPRIAHSYFPLYLRRLIEQARILLYTKIKDRACYELDIRNPDTSPATEGGRGQTQGRMSNGDGWSYNELRDWFAGYGDYSTRYVSGDTSTASGFYTYCESLNDVYNSLILPVLLGWDAEGTPLWKSRAPGAADLFGLAQRHLNDLKRALGTGCAAQEKRAGLGDECCTHLASIKTATDGQALQRLLDSVPAKNCTADQAPCKARATAPPDYLGDFVDLTPPEVDEIERRAKEAQSVEPDITDRPIAKFTYSPAHPKVNETVTFDASESKATVKNGTLVSYQWDFGDGTPILDVAENKITHAFKQAGTFIVKLFVIDMRGGDHRSIAYGEEIIVEGLSGLDDLFDKAGLPDPEINPFQGPIQDWVIVLAWGPLAGPYLLSEFERKVLDTMIAYAPRVNFCEILERIGNELYKPLIGIGGSPAEISKAAAASGNVPEGSLETISVSDLGSSKYAVAKDLLAKIEALKAALDTASANIFESTGKHCASLGEPTVETPTPATEEPTTAAPTGQAGMEAAAQAVGQNEPLPVLMDAERKKNGGFTVNVLRIGTLELSIPRLRTWADHLVAAFMRLPESSASDRATSCDKIGQVKTGIIDVLATAIWVIYSDTTSRPYSENDTDGDILKNLRTKWNTKVGTLQCGSTALGGGALQGRPPTPAPPANSDEAVKRSDDLNKAVDNPNMVAPGPLLQSDIDKWPKDETIIIWGPANGFSGTYRILYVLQYLRGQASEAETFSRKSGPRDPSDCDHWERVITLTVAPIIGSASSPSATLGDGTPIGPDSPSATVREIYDTASKIVNLVSPICNITFAGGWLHVEKVVFADTPKKRYVIYGRDAWNVALGRQVAVVLPRTIRPKLDESVMLAGKFDNNVYDMAVVRFKMLLPLLPNVTDPFVKQDRMSDTLKKKLYGDQPLHVGLLKLENRLFQTQAQLKPVQFADDQLGDTDPIDPELQQAEVTEVPIMAPKPLMPGNAFVPPKPSKVGRGKLTTKDNFMQLIQKKLPGYLNAKHDGMRCVIHRMPTGQIRFFTANGFELTDQLPLWDHIFKQVVSQDFILDAEFELWTEGKKQPRTRVASLMLDKNLVDDDLIANVFDIVWLNGRDLRDAPLEERTSLLQGIIPEAFRQSTVGIPVPRKINVTPYFPVQNLEEALTRFNQLMELPHIEGVIFKQRGSKYEINLDRAFSAWAKYHRAIAINSIVILRNPTANPKLFTYQMGLPYGASVEPDEVVEVNGQRLMVIGESLLTGEVLNPGDQLTVETDQVILESFDKQGIVRIRLVSPKIINAIIRPKAQFADSADDILNQLVVLVANRLKGRKDA